MNIGALPGYYFDTEKQKYFKIQPGHKLPTKDTKYSASNVRKEERAKKRHKKDSTTRSRIQSRVNSLTQSRDTNKSLLLRELGVRAPLELWTQAIVSDAALYRSKVNTINGATGQAHRENVKREIVYDAIPLAVPSMDILLLQLDHSYVEVTWNPHNMNQDVELHDDISRLYNPGDLRTVVLLQDSDSLKHLFNFYFHQRNVQWASMQLGVPDTQVQCHSIKLPADVPEQLDLWDVMISPDSMGKMAMATTTHLLCVDALNVTASAYPTSRETTSVDWLNSNVIIAGQEKGIRLWDTRIGQSLIRLKHGKRLTGVKTVTAAAGSQILASDNYGMKLYDLRMTSRNRDRYPLCFEGIHEGPKRQFDINAQGLIVADMDESIKVFSTRTGKQAGVFDLPEPSWTSGNSLKRLKWYNDTGGTPYIQACAGSEILRWSCSASSSG